MPEFKCRLGTPSGEIVTRTVEADSAEQVRAQMVAEGLKVFSVTGGGKGYCVSSVRFAVTEF